MIHGYWAMRAQGIMNPAAVFKQSWSGIVHGKQWMVTRILELGINRSGMAIQIASLITAVTKVDARNSVVRVFLHP